VDIKSTGVKDVLRKVLKRVIYISLREDKLSVSYLLRVIVINNSYNILYRLIRIFCLLTYFS